MSASRRRGNPSGRWAIGLNASLDVVYRVLMVAALLLLGVRGAVRLESGWDSLWYHLPAAAEYGGVDIPFTMQVWPAVLMQGFPPLPHLLEGLLWRITGTPHATCMVNLLAFGVFLYFCARHLGARASTVALIALSAPLVLLQVASNYVDLFANSFLAIGVSGTFFMLFRGERHNGRLLQWSLIGLILACWSKMQLVPIAAVFFVALGCVMVVPSRLRPRRRGRMLTWVLLHALVAAAPYLKNAILYGNPFWPIRLPVLSEVFAYVDWGHIQDRYGQSLSDPSRPSLFFHSLFEIGNPVEYPDRPRYLVDMAGSRDYYFLGGFWGAGVAAALFSLVASSLIVGRRRGLVLIACFAAVIGLNMVMPQSWQLRYWLYLPLTWAAMLAVIYGQLRRRRPRLTAALRVVYLLMFLYISAWNWTHFQPEPQSFEDIAVGSGIAPYWEQMAVFTAEDPDQEFCVALRAREGILFTGPTMTEFRVVSREFEEDCRPTQVEIRP